jgi:hypothetical protein
VPAGGVRERRVIRESGLRREGYLQGAGPLLQNRKVHICIWFQVDDVGQVLHVLPQAFVAAHVALAARGHLLSNQRLLVVGGGGCGSGGEDDEQARGGGKGSEP